MIIDNVVFNEDLVDILYELREQLKINGISLFQDIKDSGDNIMVTCPYHKNGQERKPSAGILKANGTFHCFTCNETHSLPEVISYCFGKNDFGLFGHQWLVKNFATLSIENRKDIKLDFDRDIQPNQQTFVKEEELNSYRYYHPYMYERKLNNDVIERFDLGYDKDTECITFPIRDINGNTLFVARRSVKTKYFNYPSNVEKPIYGYYELLQLDSFPKEVIICESMLDALVCWVWGKYAVALNGLGSYKQYKELSKMECRKFILATDNDNAGLLARKRLRSYIKNHIITEYELPPNKKDLNDLTEEEFRNLTEKY